MYRVNYYTLAKSKDGSLGNIMQYTDVWYTDKEISVLDSELQRVVDIRKGEEKYKPIITKVEKIDGHLSR